MTCCIFGVLLVNEAFQKLDYQKGKIGYPELGTFFKAPNGNITTDSIPEYTFANFENDSILTIWKNTIYNVPAYLRDKRQYDFKVIDEHIIVYTDRPSSMDAALISSLDNARETRTDTAICYQNGVYLYLDSVMLRNNRTIAEGKKPNTFDKRLIIWQSYADNEMLDKNKLLHYMFSHPSLPNTLKFDFQDSRHRKITLLIGEDRMTVICLSDMFDPIIEEYEVSYYSYYAIGVNIGKCISSNRPGSVSTSNTLRPFRDTANLSRENALPVFEGKSFTANWMNRKILSDISLDDFLFTRDECPVLDDADMNIKIDKSLLNGFYKKYKE